MLWRAKGGLFVKHGGKQEEKLTWREDSEEEAILPGQRADSSARQRPSCLVKEQIVVQNLQIS